MSKILTFILLLALPIALSAQEQDDPRCLHFMGIPLEGPADSLCERLKGAEFIEWGTSEDGEDLYFRGKFYGIRAKLLVSVTPATGLVRSAYVTVGPYSTKAMLERNFQYFLLKMQQDHGTFAERDDARYYMDDFGSVKMSVVDNENGSRDIRVLYYPIAPYYKDALCRGLHGNVQEVVTENAVAEDQFLRFEENGQMENPDLTDREYDRYGYLVHARMTEQNGHSDVRYEYDGNYRLKRRTLVNEEAGVRYVNDYAYNEQDEVVSENQKVFDRHNQCVMTINMHNDYLTRDDNGNWTSNSLTLTYWEKGSRSQQVSVLQRRTLTYWE